jgi:integral membrane protein
VTAPSRPPQSGEAAAFRVVAVVEAVSYLLLLGAVVLYRVMDGPRYIGTLGPIHGIAVLIYAALVLRIREEQGWDGWKTILIMGMSAVPFGGFWAGSHLRGADPLLHGGGQPSLP